VQDRLIQRYLGNKAPIAKELLAVIDSLASPGDLVFDAFSGTLAVSASLQRAGYQVATNDINHFSWTYANAYFSVSELPWPDAPKGRLAATKRLAWQSLIDELISPYTCGIPERARRSDIFDHYCELGDKSAFVSSRGRRGRRRFFSPSNARSIDRALSRLRYWVRQSLVSEHTRCLLMASLLSGVEKVSNTQGTFHDFPRKYTDPRSRQPLSLKVPHEDSFHEPSSSHIGKAVDTLDYVNKVPPHRVIYVDPPYNFRQYTSYYFMLNLLSRYPDIGDLNDYFGKIEFVRGQNMESDFRSTFSRKRTFIPSLRKLIGRAKARYVVLSYFDGRNHWGDFKSDAPERTGRAVIEDLFSAPPFVSRNSKCIPVRRMNYQSYGGYSAREVNEFIFVGEKATPCR
jgi:adenine-specific DNA methylase